jgi:DNA-binding NtrC family response regulator
MALEALVARIDSREPFLVAGPPGMDLASVVARAHLDGARAAAPLVFIDGTDVEMHHAARWADAARSPLRLADEGILVLLDAPALPSEVQSIIGRACVMRRLPWDADRTLGLQLVATTTRADGGAAFDPILYTALGDAGLRCVVIPELADRAEDFRALVMHRLANAGLRILGRPVGIEPAALARLANRDFPGDVAELDVLVQRLVAGCRGDAVTLADLDTVWASGPPTALAAGIAGRSRGASGQK